MQFVAEAHVHFHRGAGKDRRDYRQTVPLCPQLHMTLQGRSVLRVCCVDGSICQVIGAWAQQQQW